MESKVNYTVVGAFVIVLIAFFVLAIIWLSSGFASGEDFKRYLVYMDEAVTGLTVDSPVKYNGVDVGTIKDIEINLKNPKQVVLTLEIKESTPIMESTTATINTQGITGIAYINLQTDNLANNKPLTAKPGQEYPVIKTKPSLFFRLDTLLTTLSNNLSETTQSINQLLNPENRKAISGVLVNLNQVAITLAANNKKIDSILANTSQATQQLPDIVQRLNEQTIPTMNAALLKLNHVANNLLETSSTVKQNPAILIRGEAPATPGPGEQ